jgi:hypothetical protein
MTPVLPNGPTFPTLPGTGGGSLANELNPFIVARIQDGTFEPAVWRLQEGQKGLAIFTTQFNADKYIGIAKLASNWKSMQLPRPVLIELLKTCLSSEIPLAVLDPDGERAKLIFSLTDVIQAVGG